jgi:hypothetical protein
MGQEDLLIRCWKWTLGISKICPCKWVKRLVLKLKEKGALKSWSGPDRMLVAHTRTHVAKRRNHTQVRTTRINDEKEELNG